MPDFEKHEPFGPYPIPAHTEVVSIPTRIGDLTAYHATPPGEIEARVILICGYTGAKEDQRMLLPLLAEAGFEVYAYSQRGQADSAGTDDENDYTLAAFASDALQIAQLVDDREVPLHIVGHSFGGVVARAAVIEVPTAFASLTMLASGPHGWEGRKTAQIAAAEQGMDAFIREIIGEDADRSEAEIAAEKGDEVAAATAAYRDRIRASKLANVLQIGRILETNPDTTDALAATGVRVLVAHGDADDAWPIAWQRDMADRLEADYEIIAHAGHVCQIDNPRGTADALVRFWGPRGRSAF